MAKPFTAPRPVIRTRFGEVIKRYRSLEHAARDMTQFVYYGWRRYASDRMLEGVRLSAYGLTYADGSEIGRRGTLFVFGHRLEDEHARYRGHGPINGIAYSGGKSRVYRHPKTQSHRVAFAFVDTEAGEPPVRAKRTSRYLPTAWDDCSRSDLDHRSWKKQRATQWK